MKKFLHFLTIAACTSALFISLITTASATTFVRKFNGAQGVKNSVAAPGNSTYSNGIVTMNLPALGSLCWSYISDAKNLTFQFRIDTDSDPEFDWFGMNITTGSSNPYDMLLGHGNGLSTLFWRTSTDITSRFVEDNCKWDSATKKEIIGKPLYDGVTPPYQDFRWGDGEWATFSMKRSSNGTWNITVNGINMVRNRYSGFDADMDRIFLNSNQTVISFFLSNPTGTLQLKGIEPSAATTTKKSSNATTTAKKPDGNTTNKAGTGASGITTGSTAAVTDKNGSTVTQIIDSSETDSSDTQAIDSTTTVTDKAVSGNNDDKKDNSSFPWAIVIIAVVVIAGGGTALYLFVLKKK